MKVALVTGEIAVPPLALALIYWKLIRPWVRERTVATDGLFCVMALAITWQDPISNYFAPYLTYNSYLLNMGSWVQGIPGWQTYGSPGAMTVDPILFSGWTYPLTILPIMSAGCWFMKAVRRRWPGVGNLGLVASLFAVNLIVWPPLESGIVTRLGIFETPGATLSLFPETYHKYGVGQWLCAAAFYAGFTCLRYFKDDQGQTWAERGLERLAVSRRRATALRVLAIIGIGNVIYLVAYNVPLAVWTGMSTGGWPADLQSRSYLTDALCGDGTNRLCPHSGGTTPRIIRFNSVTDVGPYSGPLLGNTHTP
jgi:hypothetical protein